MPKTLTSLRILAPTLLSIGVLLSAPGAYADPPEVTVYCRTHVHPSLSYSYRIDGVKTPPFCMDAKSPKRTKPVDMAMACEMTSGSTDFRYLDGFRIDCSRNPRPLVSEGPGVQLLQPEDLGRYCTEWYGAGSNAEYSATLKRSICTSDAGPQTVNFMFLCDLYYKTDKVRYVLGEDDYYVACVK